MEKINEEFIFALNFAQNITQLLLVFSKEAIFFLIYLLANKANYHHFVENHVVKIQHHFQRILLVSLQHAQFSMNHQIE